MKSTDRTASDKRHKVNGDGNGESVDAGTPEPLDAVDEKGRKVVKQKHGGTLHQYPKGVSGNPTGRPSQKPVTDAYNAILAMPRTQLASYKPKTGVEKLAWAMIQQAWNAQSKLMVSAAREVTDRIEGSVAAPLVNVGVTTASEQALIEIWEERKRQRDGDDGAE